MMNLRTAGIPATLVLLLGAAACGGSDPEPAEEVVRIPGATVVVRDTVLPDLLPAAGLAEPILQATLSTRLMARVTEVTVHEGARVSAGQLLVRLDASDLEAKRLQVEAGVRAAEAGRNEARLYADRIRKLYADSAAPRVQLDAAEAGLARAEAGWQASAAAGSELQATRAYSEVRAPFPGVVTKRFVDPGAFAAPGAPLVTVEDHRAIRISATVAADLPRPARGSRVTATVSGVTVEAEIEGVVPAPGGHVVTVNAIVANPGGALRPGAAATLGLPLGDRRVVVVPFAAVVREGDLTGVRVRTAGGDQLRWVRLGKRYDAMIEVLSGVVPGDTVLVPEGSR